MLGKSWSLLDTISSFHILNIFSTVLGKSWSLLDTISSFHILNIFSPDKIKHSLSYIISKRLPLMCPSFLPKWIWPFGCFGYFEKLCASRDFAAFSRLSSVRQGRGIIKVCIDLCCWTANDTLLKERRLKVYYSHLIQFYKFAKRGPACTWGKQ